MENRIEKSSDPAEYGAHMVDPAYVDVYKPSTMPDGAACTPTFAHPKSAEAQKSASGHLQWFRARFGSHGEVLVRLCKGRETDQLRREEFDRIMQVLSEKTSQIQALLDYSATQRRRDWAHAPAIRPESVRGELNLNVTFPGTYDSSQEVRQGERIVGHRDRTHTREEAVAYLSGTETTVQPSTERLNAGVERAAEAVKRAIDAALERLPKLPEENTAQPAARPHIEAQRAQKSPVEAA